MKIFILSLCFFSFAFGDSFYKAKRQLLEYFEKNPKEAKTLYCGKEFQVKNNKIISKENISFEHIVPVSLLAKHLPCWKQGGRKACAKDKEFKQLEGDILNIAPALAKINTIRKNYPYGDWNFENDKEKECKVFVKNKVFFPANESKRKIAKVYLQMAQKYNVEISKEEKQMFLKWLE